MEAYRVCFASPQPWVPSLHTPAPTGEDLHNCCDRCHHFPAATRPWQLSENSLPGSASKTIFFFFLNHQAFLPFPIFFFPLFKKYFSGDFPGGSNGKESACNAGDPSSILRSGRFPWGRAWQSTPVFLPGESHGQRSLEGYSPRDPEESDTTEQLMLSLSRQSNSIIHIYTHSFLYFLFHYGLS